jgi:hypothetical protein
MQRKFIFAAALLGACTLVQAAGLDAVKPGLWEVSSKFASSDGQVEAAMAGARAQLENMAPEQRQAMQQMLERNGVQLDLGAGGTLRTRMCMTREMIARRELPLQQGQCTQQVTQASPTHVKVAFNCTQPRASGEGDVTIESPTRYRAHMTLRGEQTQNRPVDTDAVGTWIAADCGSVRPAQAMPTK